MGSSRPTGDPRLSHRDRGFSGLRLGTVEISLRLHASRQSTGKVLRYLKRVIVTPAVYQILARLDPGLNYWHWADVTLYTHHYWLAGG